jgi:glycosyltransferase involved in cell wall biosynthesis
MPDIIRLADGVAYPSETVEDWAEQFGYTVAKAMACEIPVVTMDCGSLPYVVGKLASLVHRRIRKLLRRISPSYLDEKRRGQLDAAARERVLSEFSLSAVADTHLCLLANIAK